MSKIVVALGIIGIILLVSAALIILIFYWMFWIVTFVVWEIFNPSDEEYNSIKEMKNHIKNSLCINK